VAAEALAADAEGLGERGNNCTSMSMPILGTHWPALLKQGRVWQPNQIMAAPNLGMPRSRGGRAGGRCSAGAWGPAWKRGSERVADPKYPANGLAGSGL
jgi:hypothetical protein